MGLHNDNRKYQERFIVKRKKFFKRRFLCINIFIWGFMTIIVLLYFWGSAGNLSEEELAVLKKYQVNHTSQQKNFYTVMTYNIGYLSGMTNNLPVQAKLTFYQSNMEKVLKFFSEINPDFIGFQEIDLNSKRSYFINQLDTVAERKEYGYSAYTVTWAKNYVPFPFWPPAVHFGKMLSGQAVLSRFEIFENTRIVLSKPQNNPFFYNAFYLDRIIQVTKLNVNKRTLIIINIHLEAFDQQTRESQADIVFDIYNMYAKDFPVLLIGDFNCVPPFASKKTGFTDEPNLDYSLDRTMKKFFKVSSIKEAIPYEVQIKNEAATFTYPSDKPTMRVDYIFYTPASIEPINGYVSSLPGTASDHLPVVFQFSFKH